MPLAYHMEQSNLSRPVRDILAMFSKERRAHGSMLVNLGYIYVDITVLNTSRPHDTGVLYFTLTWPGDIDSSSEVNLRPRAAGALQRANYGVSIECCGVGIQVEAK